MEMLVEVEVKVKTEVVVLTTVKKNLSVPLFTSVSSPLPGSSNKEEWRTSGRNVGIISMVGDLLRRLLFPIQVAVPVALK